MSKTSSAIRLAFTTSRPVGASMFQACLCLDTISRRFRVAFTRISEILSKDESRTALIRVRSASVRLSIIRFR